MTETGALVFTGLAFVVLAVVLAAASDTNYGQAKRIRATLAWVTLVLGLTLMVISAWMEAFTT